MKKFAIVFSTFFALSIFTITAQENEGAKKTGKASSTTTTATTAEHKFVSADQMQWGAAPPGLPPGAQVAVLDGDPNKKGSFTLRLKMPADIRSRRTPIPRPSGSQLFPAPRTSAWATNSTKQLATS